MTSSHPNLIPTYSLRRWTWHCWIPAELLPSATVFGTWRRQEGGIACLAVESGGFSRHELSEAERSTSTVTWNSSETNF